MKHPYTRRLRAVLVTLLVGGTALAAPALSAPAAASLGAEEVEDVKEVEVIHVDGQPPLPAPMREELAIALHHATDLVVDHPHDLAHPWVDRSRGTLLLGAVTAEGRSLATDWTATVSTATAPVEVVSVGRSYAELERIKHGVTYVSEEDIPGIRSVFGSYVDAEHNRVMVDADATPETLLRGLASLFGQAVVVRYLPGGRPLPVPKVAVRPVGGIEVPPLPPVPPIQEGGRNRQNDKSPYYGGARIVVPGGSCTSGFPWRGDGGGVAMLTAGHCIPNGGDVFAPNGSHMGSVIAQCRENWDLLTGTVPFCHEPGVNRGDIALVIDPDLAVDPRIYVGGVESGASKEVTAMWHRRAVSGDFYCTGGISSGELCGWKVGTFGDIFYEEEQAWIRNVVVGIKDEADGCIIDGDSGGPVYTASATTVTGKGITSGSGHGDIFGCMHFFTDIWDAQEAFGGGLRTPVVPGADTLFPNQRMDAGDALWSSDGRYVARMQSDGNFVIYKPGNQFAGFATNTDGHPGAWAIMQSDGNFVVYAPNNDDLFATGTRVQNSTMTMQNDCNLVIYAPGPFPVWSSNTANC